MKKLLIIVALIGLTTICFAQDTKTPPAPVKPAHPGWEFKPATPITFTVTLPAALIDTYIYVGTNGGPQAIASSDRLNGQQITNINRVYQATLDSLNASVVRAYQKFIKDDQAKFTADTLKLYHPKK